MKITRRELIYLWREGSIKLEGSPEYTIVEEGDWDGAGEKYQTLGVVFTDGSRFYSGTIMKSGSYFSAWEYVDWGNADITEVAKVTRTIEVTRWEAV